MASTAVTMHTDSTMFWVEYPYHFYEQNAGPIKRLLGHKHHELFKLFLSDSHIEFNHHLNQHGNALVEPEPNIKTVSIDELAADVRRYEDFKLRQASAS